MRSSKKALRKEPDSHWLLTRAGRDALRAAGIPEGPVLAFAIARIVPDCPLTLWHLAGTLDALGYSTEALRLFTWLLRSKKTPDDDPCWESIEWADALKTDCIFRMGLCFKHLDKNHEAAFCFRKYIDLCLLGMEGSYPMEEARRHLRQESPESNREVAKHELRETGDWVVRIFGEDAVPISGPPVIDTRGLTLTLPPL